MRHLNGHPVSFLLTGFTWLLLACLLGFAVLIGLVRGTPLPSWLRQIHVHGALIGGILQLMIGGFLASWSSRHEQASTKSYAGLFFTLNGATIALLIGFGLGYMMLVGAAGVALLAATFSIAGLTWRQSGSSVATSAVSPWIMRLALVALFSGLAIGILMAFRFLPEYYAHARLLHLHLILLSFITVTAVAALPRLLSLVLHGEPDGSPVTGYVLSALLVGFAILLGGFVTSSLRLELAIGGLLVLAVGLYAYHLFRAWVRSGHSGNAASDHFLLATFFLVLTMVLGLLTGSNYLPQPPVLPFGSLHLVAYTHAALLGFLLQAIFGALSYGIPLILTVDRIPNEKKRGPYHDRLTGIMDRWRIVQLAGLSLGTMGLGVIATLTWNFPLTSLYVQLAMWTTVGLLLASLTLFAAKLAWVLGTEPTD